MVQEISSQIWHSTSTRLILHMYHGARGRTLLRYGKIQGPSHMYTMALRAEFLSDRVRSSSLIPWYRDILSHMALHKAHLSSHMPLFRRSPLRYGKVEEQYPYVPWFRRSSLIYGSRLISWPHGTRDLLPDPAEYKKHVTLYYGTEDLLSGIVQNSYPFPRYMIIRTE
jgi:hypothetical protein